MTKLLILALVYRPSAVVEPSSCHCDNGADRATAIGVGAAAATKAATAAAGFGSTGIIKGSAAAAYQSAVYGGYTAGGSLFSYLTGVAMTGALAPFAVVGAGVGAAVNGDRVPLQRRRGQR